MSDEKYPRINYGKLIKNCISSFLFYNFFVLILIFGAVKMAIVDLKIRNVSEFLWQFLLDFLSIIYSVEGLVMSKLVLIHLESLIENFNIILKYELEQTHEDCQDLISILVQIRKLFSLFNQTFGRIFTIITTTRFLDITFMVNVSIFSFLKKY